MESMDEKVIKQQKAMEDFGELSQENIDAIYVLGNKSDIKI